MTQNAILFIPDISGFTEFVHHTDINHSRHIISELLELLIDNNTMGLELAEIEGDALFLFKLENKVEIDVIKQQVQQMYLAFHTHLKRYEYERICHCGACSSAYNLNLKFVVHYGGIEFIEVKNTKKPYGPYVIQAHRLLKNDVPIKEYSIFTENILPLEEGNNETMMVANYDFGNITFVYDSLQYLREKIPVINPIPENVPKHKIFDTTETLKVAAIELYEVISNFDYRLLWTHGIDRLEYEKNKVNRAGQKHQCLIKKNQKIEQMTIAKSVEQNQLVYGESTTEIPFTRRMNVYYVLEEVKEGYTKLNIEVFVDFKPFGILLKPFIKKNFQKVISGNIKELILLIASGFKTETKTN